ncbi:serine--tRNA ligase [Candidatus Pacearchaeota archaeon]|nr:serine--tRNA ligase [Candidatus Pacearchaeota archaeon]
MLDVKFIKENEKLVKENIKKKFQKEKLHLVDKIIKLDAKWRKLKYDEDKLRSDRNKVSKEINELKKNKKDASKLIKEAKNIPGKIKESGEKRKKLEKEIWEIQIEIPNIMSKRVPIGKDDSENVEGKRYGKPKKFSFKVKNHAQAMEDLGMVDFDASARVSGTGFYYLEDKIALLNIALINYARDIMVKKKYKYVEPPLLLREGIIDRVTDLNDKQNMIYLVEDEPKMALIGTSEHSLIGRFVDQEINEKELPIKHTSYSMCFRKEIGSHGLDEKGLFRAHQFNKVEMVVICKPDARESEKFYQEMQDIAIEVFKRLEVPIRILKICSGDLGSLKYEQIDVEAWSPRTNKYYEVGSCSNLTESQARKLNITTRINGERKTPHTLNNTVIATSRALKAIIENHQQKDGSIKIPKALWEYTGFKVIKAKK